MGRVDLKGILANKELRRELMVPAIKAIQNREGIDTTTEQAEQAEQAYDRVQTAGYNANEQYQDDLENEHLDGYHRGEGNTPHPDCPMCQDLK